MVAHGGAIYLFGGQNAGTPLNGTLRYTPGTGATWETRAPMPSTRFGLSAVSDGAKIYLLGGKGNGTTALDYLEVYDPAANTWSNTVAQMPRGRHGGGAVYSKGFIYVVGGEDSSGTPIAEFDIYDIAQNKWTTGPALPTPRSLAGVTLNQDLGRISGGYTGVVVAGGLTLGGQATTVVEEYVINDNVWRERRSLDGARHGAAAVAIAVPGPIDDLSARTWLVGGQLTSGLTDSIVSFGQDQDYVRPMADLPAARFRHAAVETNGLIYVFGGRASVEETVVWVFDPELQRDVSLSPLPTVQNSLGAVAARGKIYAVGGADQFANPIARFRSYDPVTNAWTELPPLPTARRAPAVVLLGDDIYAIGGYNGGAMQTVEVYSLSTGSWRTAPMLPVGIEAATAVTYQGSIYLMAGQSGGAPVSTVYRFSAGAWSTAGGTGVPIMNATAVRVHDRQVLLAGGRDASGLRNAAVSYALDTLTLDTLRTDSFLQAHDLAAAAMLNGDLYLFGGNYTAATDPPGSPLVRKVDASCFNGVQDGREAAADQGGTCPPRRIQFSGVRTSVAAATVTGWTPCWTSTYATSVALSTILAQCTGKHLMLGCRAAGSSTYSVLAHAPRADVLFDVGTGTTATHVANGVAWYYSPSMSWGFAAGGDSVSRNSCDTGTVNGASRLCWHTSSSSVSSGYRCGTNTGVSSTWERVILQAD